MDSSSCFPRILYPRISEGIVVIHCVIGRPLAANYANGRLFVDRTWEKNALHREIITCTRWLNFSSRLQVWYQTVNWLENIYREGVIELDDWINQILIVFTSITLIDYFPNLLRIGIIIKFDWFNVSLRLENNGDKRCAFVAQSLGHWVIYRQERTRFCCGMIRRYLNSIVALLL